MIASDELTYIEEHAYLPEHLIRYVTAISPLEPFLVQDFLLYVEKERAVFVGYPLSGTFEEKKMERVLKDVIKRFRPKEMAITSPAIMKRRTDLSCSASDQYYRLDLSTLSISQKLRNMLHRAGRELSVTKGKTFGGEHRKLVLEFIESHPIGDETRLIFERIPEYISAGATAWIFEVRNDKEEMVAFDVADFGSRHYAFYMFNFSSLDRYVPGASDLLLREVIETANDEKKKYINLGLGINEGVAFFKKKWEADPFLPYRFYLYTPGRVEPIDALFQKL